MDCDRSVRCEVSGRRARTVQPKVEPGKKKLMVNGGKDCRKAKKNKGGRFTLVNCKEEDHFECEEEQFQWN